MTIGLTGGTGVIGRLIHEKIGSSCTVSCFDGDIRNQNEVDIWIRTVEPDAVIHLAAMVPTTDVERDPISALDINVFGTFNLCKALSMRDHNVWLFYASTSHVYKSKESPISERDEISPISLYGSTKFLAENICKIASKDVTMNIDLCIGRIFSFYHESQRIPFLYPTILKRLRQENLEDPFFLQGADSTRDFLRAEEVADLILKLCEERIKGVVNIASGEGVRIRDFVQQLSENRLKIVTNNNSDYLVANVDKLKILLRE